MRTRITIEVDTARMPKEQFNAEVLRKIAELKWPVVYLATEEVDTSEMIDVRKQGLV